LIFRDAKLIALAVLLLLLLVTAGTFYVSHLASRAARVDRAEAATAKIAQEFTDYKTAQTQLDGERAAASRGYRDEIASLRRAVDTRHVPVVRLCPQRPVVLPAAPDPAGRPDNAPAPAGLVSDGVGADSQGSTNIGPALARTLDRADELSAQLRAVLAFSENRLGQ
jgi:hypothetical protein